MSFPNFSAFWDSLKVLLSLAQQVELTQFCMTNRLTWPSLSRNSTIVWEQMEFALSSMAPVYQSLSVSCHVSPTSCLLLWTYWTIHRFLNPVCSFISLFLVTFTLSALICFPPLLSTESPASFIPFTSLLPLPEGVNIQLNSPCILCFPILQHLSCIYFHFSVFSSVCPSLSAVFFFA